MEFKLFLGKTKPKKKENNLIFILYLEYEKVYLIIKLKPQDKHFIP